MTAKNHSAGQYPPFALPAGLTHEQNFLLAIGQLIADWAICESVLRGVFVCLTGGATQESSDYAQITWLSTVNNKARCELLTRCTHASRLPENFKDEIFSSISRFDGITRSRNFYAHAPYEADPSTLEFVAIVGYQPTLDHTLVRETRKLANSATLNEIVNAIQRCKTLGTELFAFLVGLKRFLAVDLPELPELPPGYAQNPRFP